VKAAREKGWATEIKLAEDPGSPTVNFISFFFDSQEPLHPDVPFNNRHLQSIRYRFRKFKLSLIEKRPVFYPRANRKNMSRSTRREFEETFQSDISSFPIFGQDDWERVYHETGIKLGGSCEFRQKWTPNIAKPRTYVAMGGKAYEPSRFLQDFFTDLVNIFPATNHITRLRPSRLRISVDDDGKSHYLIYDLSSFTSNSKQQKAFCLCLKEFFKGVIVVVVDERFGPLERDLGELLEEYYDACVDGPEVSYERSIFEDLKNLTNRKHARASLLGIFGNLMTCTLCHYLILSPCTDSDDTINIAGDDGLVWETLLNKYLIDTCITLVGDYAQDKTYRSNELGAVCLKRPICEIPPILSLQHNIVPPNFGVSLSYLLGENIDPRFDIIFDEELSVEDRVSVVGKDLLRFLESCFELGASMEESREVFVGFSKLVAKTLGFYPNHGRLVRDRYVWPLDPSSYEYYSISPLTVYAYVCCTSLEFHVRRVEEISSKSLQFAGEECSGNSNRRLVLLERLGYLEKKPINQVLEGIASVEMWIGLQKSKTSAPVLYRYTCVKSIPMYMLFDVDDIE
jgi:hypothetical protein